ncbi:MAG TPA: ABC transporter ATP-binding protein, partial [Azospirillaceae bacterium]|nr:ABC transporter ATP-binding protein [Azospirillaceae bacterium]
VAALRGVTLAIEPATMTAVLGPNGGGKTTLFLHLNGTLRPTRGAVRLAGEPVAYDRRALKRWRGQVGLVLQDPDDQLFAPTIRQDIAFGPYNLGLKPAEIAERVMEALTALDLDSLADRPTHHLSFGQKRRVAIAGVVAMRPRVLLLDEPMAGLDAEGVDQLLDILDGLRRAGTTVVFSTHDIELAWRWADRVAVLAAGRLIASGSTADVLGDGEVLTAAKLKAPLVLDLARALRDAGHPWPADRPPRSREALLNMIRKGKT